MPAITPRRAPVKAKPAVKAAAKAEKQSTPRAKELASARTSFRDRQFALREEAIIEAVNRQLTSKGYEAMVLDDIAAEVGIAKGSLYKHFSSKEALAAAALKSLLHRLIAKSQSIPAGLKPIEKLREILRWALSERCEGRLPTLPSGNTALRDTLSQDKAYVQTLSDLTDIVGHLIEQAVAAKELRGDIDPTVLMFSLYARSCDPTFEFLRATQSMPDSKVVDSLVAVAFGGFEAHA
jgi:TetR/AcrR family transcriptional regulator, regulator of autoinduction and epiphytic fitness